MIDRFTQCWPESALDMAFEPEAARRFSSARSTLVRWRARCGAAAPAALRAWVQKALLDKDYFAPALVGEQSAALAHMAACLTGDDCGNVGSEDNTPPESEPAT